MSGWSFVGALFHSCVGLNTFLWCFGKSEWLVYVVFVLKAAWVCPASPWTNLCEWLAANVVSRFDIGFIVCPTNSIFASINIYLVIYYYERWTDWIQVHEEHWTKHKWDQTPAHSNCSGTYSQNRPRRLSYCTLLTASRTRNDTHNSTTSWFTTAWKGAQWDTVIQFCLEPGRTTFKPVCVVYRYVSFGYLWKYPFKELNKVGTVLDRQSLCRYRATWELR